MVDGYSFFRRWAQRKAAAAEHADDEQPLMARARTRPSEVDELPDIDTLGTESDFSVFMREGVPSALRKQALRKLWRVDPAFSELDGLVEYGEDYSGKRTTVETVRTAVRIGRRAASADGRDGAAFDGDERDRNDPGEDGQDGNTA